MKRRGAVITWLVLLAWGAALGFGEWQMADFANRPELSAPAPARWPAESALASPAAAQLVLLFAHPMCPCTRATIAELERLLARRELEGAPRADVRVLFVWDDATAPDWNARGSWDAAQAIPGVSVTTDLGGVEARRFGATTSGTVLLFGSDRTLRFHGGITAARGHEGENAGASAVRALLAGDVPAEIETPVFGCPLFTSRTP